MKHATLYLYKKNLVNLQLEDNMTLVNCDVEAPYMSIRHQGGIRAVQSFLYMSNMDKDLCDLAIKMLEVILTHNFFLFRESLFLHFQGTAMEVACAPSYANLFLRLWERGIFCTDSLQKNIYFWRWYIDDIMFIWQGTVDDLDQFMKNLNSNDLNINLTYKCGKNNMDFLDMDDNVYLCSDLFRKPTATNTFLHAQFAHPKHLISNIPVSQFLRLKRICSTEELLIKQAKNLSIRFQVCGYPSGCIQKSLQESSTDHTNVPHATKEPTKGKWQPGKIHYDFSLKTQGSPECLGEILGHSPVR